jgi:hypothetical protein
VKEPTRQTGNLSNKSDIKEDPDDSGATGVLLVMLFTTCPDDL